jgi:hypothetical protein
MLECWRRLSGVQRLRVYSLLHVWLQADATGA